MIGKQEHRPRLLLSSAIPSLTGALYWLNPARSQEVPLGTVALLYYRVREVQVIALTANKQMTGTEGHEGRLPSPEQVQSGGHQEAKE